MLGLHSTTRLYISPSPDFLFNDRVFLLASPALLPLLCEGWVTLAASGGAVTASEEVATGEVRTCSSSPPLVTLVWQTPPRLGRHSAGPSAAAALQGDLSQASMWELL